VVISLTVALVVGAIRLGDLSDIEHFAIVVPLIIALFALLLGPVLDHIREATRQEARERKGLPDPRRPSPPSPPTSPGCASWPSSAQTEGRPGGGAPRNARAAVIADSYETLVTLRQVFCRLVAG
jgi:hypothetical protein